MIIVGGGGYNELRLGIVIGTGNVETVVPLEHPPRPFDKSVSINYFTD